MGQSESLDQLASSDVVPHLQIQVLSKMLSEIGSLSYDDFKKSLNELNELSRKCLDADGKQLVFLIKKGTDTSFLWKATVRIACVKVCPTSRQIDAFKFLNLKQFLNVFKTFQSNLESLLSSEAQLETNHSLTASALLEYANGLDRSPNLSPTSEQQPSDNESFSECCICLERKTEVLLPCTHVFCTPCIEQWNVNNKTCPVCCQALDSTDETWIMSEIPGVDEISEKICSELMDLSKINKNNQ